MLRRGLLSSFSPALHTLSPATPAPATGRCASTHARTFLLSAPPRLPSRPRNAVPASLSTASPSHASLRHCASSPSSSSSIRPTTLPLSHSRQTTRRLSSVRGYSTAQLQEHEVKTSKKGRVGNPEELTVTEQAAQQLLRLAEKDRQPNQALRITVESGGCHGFQYHLDLTTTMQDDDVIFEKNGAKVLVDNISLPFIHGSTLDYVQELIGSAFRITANPNATTGCGCGTSFGV